MALKYVLRLRAWLASRPAAIRDCVRRRPPTLEELLDRSGVPRHLTPELREAALLAGLKLDGGESGGEGAGEGKEGEAGKESTGKAEGAEGEGKESGKSDGDEGGGEGKVEPEDDWKTKSRKNETRAKRAERELKEEREEREKREETEKSEHEKALEKAKKEGRAEVETKAAQERKADRLEVSVTRLAGKKLKVGDGDDAEEVRFADPEDALMHVERAISRDEIDAEDIFDKDGKVDSNALQKELVELLERKPHLRESTGSGKTPEPKKGDPDTRKGDPVDGSLESMSAEDHATRKYGTGK